MLRPPRCNESSKSGPHHTGDSMNDRNIMKTNHAKQKQTFTFNAPAALRVLLVGDFTQWQKNPIPLEKQPNGTWRATVPLETGTYRYRFLVDGEWCDDPNCTLRVPNPFGSRERSEEHTS